MTINERRLLLLAIIFSFYLSLLSFALTPVVGQSFLITNNKKGLLTAVSVDRKNATYYYLLGRLYHYDIGKTDIGKAIEYYSDSLRLDPLQTGCWLDLAKARLTAGLTADADSAMNKATSLSPNNPAVMWEAGIFYLASGDIQRSVKSFREFILLDPDRQEDVYDMFWKLPLNSEYMLGHLIPDSYSYYKRYLLYLVSTDRTEDTRNLWGRLSGLKVDDELVLRYTDFLISRHLYEDAENVWKDLVERKFQAEKDKSSLLWNGSFKFDILNGGFDWKIGAARGVKIFLDSDIHMLGGRSLGVTFDGTQNPDITVASQVVMITPETKYTLKGNIKTDSLTTTNGVFLSVDGHDCNELHEKSEVVTGSNFWKEVKVEFEVPPECHAILVSIRRERSDKLDNKISGNAWIDAISLAQR